MLFSKIYEYLDIPKTFNSILFRFTQLNRKVNISIISKEDKYTTNTVVKRATSKNQVQSILHAEYRIQARE